MKFHSMSNLITNSSTTTYIYPTGDCVEKLKGILQAVLEEAGVAGDVNDLFDVRLDFDPSEEYDPDAKYFEWEEFIDCVEENLSQAEIDNTDIDEAYVRAYVKKMKDEDPDAYFECVSDIYSSEYRDIDEFNSLNVYSKKTGKRVNPTSFDGLFDSEGYYNG